MNLKRIIIIFLTALVLKIADAQEIKVKSFSMLMEPMTVPMQRKDNNGNVCSLIKFACPYDGVSFKGNVIHNERSGSEYYVYLSPGSKYLQIHIPNYLPELVDFNKWGIKCLASKIIYDLKIDIEPYIKDDSNPVVAHCLNLFTKHMYTEAKEYASKHICPENTEAINKKLQAIVSNCDSVCITIEKYNKYAKILNDLHATPIPTFPDYFLFSTKNSTGICSVQGVTTISPIFKDILCFDPNCFWALSENGWIILDGVGNKIAECRNIKNCWLSSVNGDYLINPGVVVSSHENLYGVVDRKIGSVILPIKYDGITLSDGKYIGYYRSDKNITVYDILSKSSQNVKLPGYYISYLGYGKCIVAKKRKKISDDWYAYENYGICDINGNIVLPMKYERIMGNSCESVAIEEHEKTKYGWLRKGHLYNFKYDKMLLSEFFGGFSYTHPPIFFENGWACHIYVDSMIFHPNTGECIVSNPENFQDALTKLGKFVDYNNENASKQDRDIATNLGLQYERICALSNSSIMIIKRLSDNRIGFEDIERNLMFGE